MNICEPLSLLDGLDLHCTHPEIVGLYFLQLAPFNRFSCGIRMLHIKAAYILQQHLAVKLELKYGTVDITVYSAEFSYHGLYKYKVTSTSFRPFSIC